MATTAEEIAPGYDLRPAWRLGDARIEADAIAFWNRLGILPPGVIPEERAKELALIAYKDGSVVGVTTLQPALFEPLRVRLAMLRGAVDPDHRRSHVGLALLLGTCRLIERWAAEHQDEQLAGVGAVIEAPELAAGQKQPFWPRTRLGLIGYTPDGRQIRMSWFEHYRLA